MTVQILRGLPGSGKSTWARKQENATIVSADDYFVDVHTGEYNFHLNALHLAHQSCFKKFLAALTFDTMVIVDNTNTKLWECAPYVLAAESLGHDVQIVVFVTPFDVCAERNIHGVPKSKIFDMKTAYEKSLPWWNEIVVNWR